MPKSKKPRKGKAGSAGTPAAPKSPFLQGQAASPTRFGRAEGGGKVRPPRGPGKGGGR